MPVSALHFYVSPENPRCFLEEVPAETLVVGEYKNPDFVVWGSPSFTGSGVKYEVKDPSGAIIKGSGCDGTVRCTPPRSLISGGGDWRSGYFN